MASFNFKQSGLVWLWLTAIFLVADLWTKFWAIDVLSPVHHGPTIEVMPYFNFNLAHNYGAAFSFLGDAGGWQRYLFTGLTIVISTVLLVWMARTPSNRKLINIGIALVLAGAFGNLYDRITYGYVIDFIDWFMVWDGVEKHWPTFNIADSVILIGVGLLIIDSFVNPEPKPNKKK